jgi:hypothetical protein
MFILFAAACIAVTWHGYGTPDASEESPSAQEDE